MGEGALEFKISWQNSAGKEGETEKVSKQQKQKAFCLPEEDEEQTMAEEIFPSLLCFFLFDRRARFSCASPDGRRRAGGGRKGKFEIIIISLSQTYRTTMICQKKKREKEKKYHPPLPRPHFPSLTLTDMSWGKSGV